MSMDEVTPGLWIGDLPSALNVEKLRANGIYSILSAMRGRLTIQETFIRHQVLLDDTEDTDILQHFLPSIHFIEAELNKGRGVLVHCHAGVSRSAAVVAAYLMYSKKLDTESALEMIRSARPSIGPNEGFLRQLELFHKAQFQVSRRDKSTRMFYMERAHDEVMYGDGTLPETDMFAKHPHTPSDSAPNTPGHPRRRIRCKMCRHELATREHMLDHGQLGPATPAAATPAISRRPSSSVGRGLGLSPANRLQSPTGTPERPRRPSVLGESLAMSSFGAESSVAGLSPASRRSSGEKSPLQNLAEISHTEKIQSSSALESDEDDPIVTERKSASPVSMVESQTEISRRTAQLIGRRMSDAVISPLKDPQESPLESLQTMRYALDENHPQQAGEKTLPTTFISPSELAAELMTNPKLAALRTHGLETSPTPHLSRPPSQSQSAPILMNPKCSGYFVEPMKWMESFLSDGQIAGKIICPNPKCGAKLGNYDWAGVSCGCKEWVTPGFCINRSKVDEIVK